MARSRPNQRTRSSQPLPAMDGFAQRVAALRTLRADDPAEAGDQALKLLEEYFESLAQLHGFRGEGSLGRYVSYLRGRDALVGSLLERAEGYTQVRNCLAHTYGLQVTPEMASEILGFVEELLKQGAERATELMTSTVRTLNDTDRLAHARDVMLSGNYGRLPVLRGDEIVGLLVERDIVAALTRAERTQRAFGDLTVASALPKNAMQRLALVAPTADREQIAELLRNRRIIACLVTPTGARLERPIGIITHADLLYHIGPRNP